MSQKIIAVSTQNTIAEIEEKVPEKYSSLVLSIFQRWNESYMLTLNVYISSRGLKFWFSYPDPAHLQDMVYSVEFTNKEIKAWGTESFIVVLFNVHLHRMVNDLCRYFNIDYAQRIGKVYKRSEASV